MIYSQVERWRPLLQETLRRVAVVEPWLLAPVRELGLSQKNIEDVLLAITQRESSGNPSAIGDGRCSLGLMMVNVCVGRVFPDLAHYAEDGRGELLLTPIMEYEQLGVPQIALEAGVRIFLQELADLDDVEYAILGYNGHGTVRRWLEGAIPQPSNLEYLEDVLAVLGVPFGYFSDLKKKTGSLVFSPR